MCSGILQQGYAFGYLLAAVINLGVVPKSPYSWRSLYFVGAGFSLAAAIVRACLPESRQFIVAREEAKHHKTSTSQATRMFLREFANMLKTNWIRCIWAICMMTGRCPFTNFPTKLTVGFNFLSHGSQDLYPTYLQTTKGFSPDNSNTIVSNVGAIVGGTIAGYVSQYTGRRLA
jgi:SHS family lactate transporter-like MFS transporter